jgi:hypothetical protein
MVLQEVMDTTGGLIVAAVAMALGKMSELAS